MQLLEYQTQQYRLFPELAKAFAFLFAGGHIRTDYVRISEQVKQGDTEHLPHVSEKYIFR